MGLRYLFFISTCGKEYREMKKKYRRENQKRKTKINTSPFDVNGRRPGWCIFVFLCLDFQTSFSWSLSLRPAHQCFYLLGSSERDQGLAHQFINFFSFLCHFSFYLSFLWKEKKGHGKGRNKNE